MAVLLESGQPTELTDPVVVTHSLVVIGVFYWLPGLLAYAASCSRDQKRRAAVVLSALASVVLTHEIPWSSWGAFRKLGLWEHFLKYWRVRVVSNHSFPAGSRQCMFGVCPHGIVPYSLGLLAFGRLSALFNSPRIVIASVVRWIPVFSQVLKWGGAIEATDAHISAELIAGQSLAVTPGGIAEMFYSGAQGCKNEVVVLGSRKGFVRHAIKHGAALVPVYVFGANSLFHRVALPQAITDLSRYLRASIMLFFGRFGLPIPFSTPLVYAVGQSILLNPWPCVGPPTQDEVDFVHNAFIRSLVCAFEENKQGMGELNII